MKRMPALLSDVSTIAQERGFQPYAHPADVVAFALLVLTRADAETVALAEYREELEYALNTLIGNPVHTEADEEQN